MMTADRDLIVESMARALFVSAYADCVDDWADRGGAPDERPEQAACGVDWMDVAPETPEAAKATARYLAGKIERLNGCTLGDLFVKATMACAEGRCTGTHDLDHFGHYLAMEALGHGVGWWDDHEEFPMKVPDVEYTVYPDFLEGEGSH